MNTEESLQLADYAWMQSLSKSLADARYDRFQSYTLELLDNGEIDVPEYARSVPMEELADGLRRFFASSDNSQLSHLLEQGLAFVSTRGDVLPDTLALLELPIPTLNGFVIQTPYLKTPAMVLNHGLMAYVAFAAHLVLGLTGFTDARYCLHSEPPDFFAGLIDLAKGMLRREPAMLLDIRATRCLGTQEHANTKMIHEASCTLAEMFLIMHELAHISLAHLDTESTTDIALTRLSETSDQASVRVFNRTQLLEIEADSHAIKHLLELGLKGGLASTDVGFAVGVLMIFEHIYESLGPASPIDSHPPALDRWRAISDAPGIASTSGSMMDSIDYILSYLAPRF